MVCEIVIILLFKCFRYIKVLKRMDREECDIEEYSEEEDNSKEKECLYCNKTFQNRIRLKLHDDENHVKDGRYLCPYNECGESFIIFHHFEFLNHLKRHVTTQKSLVVYNISQKVQRNSFSLLCVRK